MSFSLDYCKCKEELSQLGIYNGIITTDRENINKPYCVYFESVKNRVSELPLKGSPLATVGISNEALLDLESNAYEVKDVDIPTSNIPLARSWFLWSPSPPLVELIDTIDPPTSIIRSKKMVDLGCGGGRDLRFMFKRTEYHQQQHKLNVEYPNVSNWDIVGIDHDIKKVNMTRESLIREGMGSIQLYGLKLSGDDKAPFRSLQGELDTSVIKDADLMLLMRFLPTRTHLHELPSYINPGGWFLMYHFVDDEVPGTWILNKETDAKFYHPKGYHHILKRNELSDLFNTKYPEFKIVCDQVKYIEDGRPLLWFLAQRIK
ncbi:hypothetical protein BC833DRAFT_586335 [Globomyces pollinis-pini]|nr:hypothetical protein BC833DRAFT_586335 [Globomyces pollinis-pini]